MQCSKENPPARQAESLYNHGEAQAESGARTQWVRAQRKLLCGEIWDCSGCLFWESASAFGDSTKKRNMGQKRSFVLPLAVLVLAGFGYRTDGGYAVGERLAEYEKRGRGERRRDHQFL